MRGFSSPETSTSMTVSLTPLAPLDLPGLHALHAIDAHELDPLWSPELEAVVIDGVQSALSVAQVVDDRPGEDPREVEGTEVGDEALNAT